MNGAIDKFIFDLDRTLWDTYDVRDNPIWAKQLIPPYRLLSADKIIDDVGAYCVLKDGAREFIINLFNDDKELGFLSVGALYEASDERQPSLQVLKLFGLYDFFKAEKFLVYKTEKKDKYLEHMGLCVFIDDSDQHLQDARKLENVVAIDKKSIKIWNEIFRDIESIRLQ